MTNLRYFYFSFILTAVGFVLAGILAWNAEPSINSVLNTLFIVLILSILEISLSFDNAIVNAATLKNMTELWRRRFLTWGILVAVFGMRLVFPVLIVSTTAGIGPIEALKLSVIDPEQYSSLMLASHLPISAYGGGFLFMVCFNYFFDFKKDVHWVHFLEIRLKSLGRLKSIELGFALLVLYATSLALADEKRLPFLIAGILGLVTYVAVDAVSTFLEISGEKSQDIQKASIGLFLYLEVLDASFSFDGVVGAFALSKNIFIIMIGLGIGALYVRSFTILLVEKGTLAEYRYLEHGAFYAIGALATAMILGTIMHIPEWFTGLIGALLILLSFIASLKHRPQQIPNEKSLG